MQIRRWGRKQSLEKAFYGTLVMMLVLEAVVLGRSVREGETAGHVVESAEGVATAEDDLNAGRGEVTEGTDKEAQKDLQKDSQGGLAPRIALTFDDGPSIYTEELLDGLKARGVKATFFVIGESAEVYPEIVTREAAEGHIVGNHTYHHVEITKLSVAAAREEIEKTNNILEKLTQKKTEYVRPPFGVWEDELEDLEMMSVMWTIDPLDWTTKNTNEIVNKVVTKAKENDIILLHDCYKSSVQAALRIIDILQSEGFEFVTVDQLFIE